MKYIVMFFLGEIYLLIIDFFQQKRRPLMSPLNYLLLNITGFNPFGWGNTIHFLTIDG